jgi:PHD/YefM family antitoxin component YafN of YafNO toxin-antitoxin module
LQAILQTKRDLDDLVDTLELLSNPRFTKNLEEGLKEARRGKAVKLTTEELRKRLE